MRERKSEREGMLVGGFGERTERWGERASIGQRRKKVRKGRDGQTERYIRERERERWL